MGSAACPPPPHTRAVSSTHRTQLAKPRARNWRESESCESMHEKQEMTRASADLDAESDAAAREEDRRDVDRDDDLRARRRG
eukprot:3393266-Rhodomonas_salina.1